MHFHHLVMRLCLLAFGLGAAVPAFAATPGEQDLIRDRQDRLLLEQQRRLEELRDLPGRQTSQPVIPAAPDTRCFVIDTIAIKGADQPRLSIGTNVRFHAEEVSRPQELPP